MRRDGPQCRNLATTDFERRDPAKHIAHLVRRLVRVAGASSDTFYRYCVLSRPQLVDLPDVMTCPNFWIR